MDKNNKETTLIYRAVSLEEYYSIIKTQRFACRDGGVTVKYFGVDFSETVIFANKAINKEVVAIFEVEVLSDVLRKLGDFTEVDKFLFKSGTVEVHISELDNFNNAIKRIAHKY